MARYERKDHLHQRAKREGARSRAFYKLEEMQRSHRVLARGQRVFDLGCWPGGWMQAAVARVGPKGQIVGIDLAELEAPLPEKNATALVGDLEAPDCADRLLAELGGPADVVLSDAAPKLTGVRERDRAMEERLLETILGLLPRLLAPRGDLLVKVLEGPEAQQVVRAISLEFEKAKTVKCKSTRKGSTERYLLARNYRGGVASDDGGAGPESENENPNEENRP